MQINRALSKLMIVAGVTAALSVPSTAQDTALPPIESIGATTDIRAFLLPDVPEVIHVAAVRRAWRMDPAIRDFREMSENDWDFTAAGGVLGFGAIDPDIDRSEMVAHMLSKPRASEPQPRLAPIIRAGYWLDLLAGGRG